MYSLNCLIFFNIKAAQCLILVDEGDTNKKKKMVDNHWCTAYNECWTLTKRNETTVGQNVFKMG